MIKRSKGDQFGEGQVIAIERTNTDLCRLPTWKPTWERAGIPEGRVFRAIDRHGNIRASMTDQSVALIVKKRDWPGRS